MTPKTPNKNQNKCSSNRLEAHLQTEESQSYSFCKVKIPQYAQMAEEKVTKVKITKDIISRGMTETKLWQQLFITIISNASTVNLHKEDSTITITEHIMTKVNMIKETIHM